ncbi:transglutaminase domain-containing protein [Viridibacillus arvi]|uniref:transglutaminase domain-containing protein n=1 Tax=Viridibacillus arvi TaxID=263475 RepID=UPI0034CE0A1B
MKKTIVAATLALSLLSSAIPTTAIEVEKPTIIKQKKLELPSITKVAKEKVHTSKKSLNVTVKNYEDYKMAMGKLYTELPRTMTIKTTVNENQMNVFSETFNNEVLVGQLPNYKLLAIYYMEKVGHHYIYTDNSHAKFSAKQIETYINTFADRFAYSINDLSASEKFNTIYNYVYQNFKYNATGYQYMLVGNAYKYEMACNGFSRLMYEMLNAAGIKTRIVQGEDHFYNLVSLQNVFEKKEETTVKNKEQEWFVVDVTTDIVLKTPHGATGKTTNDYLAYVQKTKFYTAKPIERENIESTELNKSLVSSLLKDNKVAVKLNNHNASTR